MSNLVVHAVPSLALTTGGPARSVPGLCASVARAGWQVRLVTVDDAAYLGEVAKAELPGVSLLRARGVHVRGLVSYSPDFKRVLSTACAESPILHSHGIWSQANYAAGKIARKKSKLHVIAPRGMLEPWARKRSVWKKMVAARLFQNRALREAACIHATAIEEYHSAREYGLKNPVAIIPNGVSVADYRVVWDPDPIYTHWPETRGKRLALFLSRVHPKKGLLQLAAAWGAVAPQMRDWHLVIAGPDENGHEAAVREAIRVAGVESQTTFAGPVYGYARARLYEACDLFVLPTHSENFGIVIAEALASGKPVITTRGAPWAEIATHDCGWYIEFGVEPLIDALSRAMSASDESRKEMGARGRKLIELQYDWAAIGKRMTHVYGWLLGHVERPAWVKLA